MFRWWPPHTTDAHVVATRSAWARAGKRVHWGPSAAHCLGHRPQRRYGRGVAGALGLADAHLLFNGARTQRLDVHLPAEQVRWVGLVGVRAFWRQQTALMVHAEAMDGWRVFVFTLADPLALAEALARLCALPVHDSRPARPDYGPSEAVQLRQDVYGAWHAQTTGQLYLAPEWLLFCPHEAIPLARIRRLDVLQGETNARPLLRVEYAHAEGQTAAVGFALPHAQAWAEAIRARMHTPAPLYQGRKRKAPPSPRL